MYETGCSGQVHWDDTEGWDREAVGRGGSRWGTHVHPWLIHVNIRKKPLQYCKVVSLQLNFFFKGTFLFLSFSFSPFLHLNMFPHLFINSWELLENDVDHFRQREEKKKAI